MQLRLLPQEAPRRDGELTSARPGRYGGHGRICPAAARPHGPQGAAQGAVLQRIALLGVDLARLVREQAELRGELERREAALTAFDRRLAEHQVRAPIAGILGHAPPLQPGAVLAENATVAHIIPGGELRIVANFRPAAIGRIVPGRPARMRLDGLPWAEYGSLRGTVVSVASEAVGGVVRVECSLDRASAPAIPLEHGLVGALEVEVERVSPAVLRRKAVAALLDYVLSIDNVRVITTRDLLSWLQRPVPLRSRRLRRRGPKPRS